VDETIAIHVAIGSTDRRKRNRRWEELKSEIELVIIDTPQAGIESTIDRSINMSNSNSFPSTYTPSTTSRVDYFYDRPGTSPGQLNVSADAPPAELVLIDYNCDRSERIGIDNPQLISKYLETHTVSWIDVLGLGNQATWDALSSVFDLHRLVVEDVVNVPQRPKIEHYQHQLLIIAVMG
jgi:magnesium transporter